MNLKTLHLNYMPNLEWIQTSALSGLQYLDEFHLHDNPFLTNIDSRAFYIKNKTDELPQLRLFDIHNCNLTYISVDLLPHWKTLDYLNVEGNPWICDCYNQAFIETVTMVSSEVAKNVFCPNKKSFFDIKMEAIVLPCPTEEHFISSFRSVVVLIVTVNVFAVVICCLLKRRFFKRINTYVALCKS